MRQSTPLASFSLIVWLHLLAAIYPFPNQAYPPIDQMADELTASEQSFMESNQTASQREAPSVVGWKSEFVQYAWVVWGLSALCLLLGLASSVAIYLRRRVGLAIALILCGVVMAVTLPPAILLLCNTATSLEEFALVWIEHPKEAYWVLGWPMVLAVLFVWSALAMKQGSVGRVA